MLTKNNYWVCFITFLVFVVIFENSSALSFKKINKNLKVSQTKLKHMDKATVKKVIDGDTFLTSKNKMIRLIGVNTPEIGHHNTKVEFMGKEAASYARKRLEGETVYLDYGIQKIDKYDRTLAYVFLKDRKFFNAELVKNGYADLMTIPPNVKYSKLFQKLAKKARKQGLGLWKKKPEYSEKLKVISWDKAGEYVDERVAVKGKVIDTYDSGKAIFLNFHKDYKHTFTAVIFKSDEYKFDFKPEKKYLNKVVKVKGEIKVYKGAPEIIIEEPEQIEIIK